MSPPSSVDALSHREFPDASVKVHLIPKCIERFMVWGGKAQGRQHPTSAPQVTVRSALASISIIVACTSSLMITSALGSVVTISLPYVGKYLNIRKDDLQRILSAYSMSSVSVLCSTVSPNLTYLAHRLASFSFVGDLQVEGPTVLEQRSSVRRFTFLADAGGAYLCCMSQPHLPVVDH
jgi:hypothetical protein